MIKHLTFASVGAGIGAFGGPVGAAIGGLVGLGVAFVSGKGGTAEVTSLTAPVDGGESVSTQGGAASGDDYVASGGGGGGGGSYSGGISSSGAASSVVPAAPPAVVSALYHPAVFTRRDPIPNAIANPIAKTFARTASANPKVSARPPLNNPPGPQRFNVPSGVSVSKFARSPASSPTVAAAPKSYSPPPPAMIAGARAKIPSQLTPQLPGPRFPRSLPPPPMSGARAVVKGKVR